MIGDLSPLSATTVADPCATCNAQYCPEGGCRWSLASVSCYGQGPLLGQDLYLIAGYEAPVNGVYSAWCFNEYSTVTSTQTTMQAICHKR